MKEDRAYDVRIDSPAIIELCLNCKRAHCYGECEEQRTLAREAGGNLYAAFGERHTLTEWAKRYDLSLGTLWTRVNRCGMTLEQALVAKKGGSRRGRRYTIDGETLTLKEWAQKLDVPYSRIVWRLRAGWSVEAAIKTARCGGAKEEETHGEDNDTAGNDEAPDYADR